jgi:hypothetical protein
LKHIAIFAVKISFSQRYVLITYRILLMLNFNCIYACFVWDRPSVESVNMTFKVTLKYSAVNCTFLYKETKIKSHRWIQECLLFIMNLLHETEVLSRFQNELFLLFYNSENSSFSNRDNSSAWYYGVNSCSKYHYKE